MSPAMPQVLSSTARSIGSGERLYGHGEVRSSFESFFASLLPESNLGKASDELSSEKYRQNLKRHWKMVSQLGDHFENC